MTRKIMIGSTKVEVSKNEAKEVERLRCIEATKRFSSWHSWYSSAPTDEARKRRAAVGTALGYADTQMGV